MIFRKTTLSDLDAICGIYDRIHSAEERGETTTGWLRKIYPVRSTAEAALKRDDLFVAEENGKIVGTAIINQQQVDVYAGAPWQYPAEDREVMVLHTLVIDPAVKGHGYGTGFVRFYEAFAREHSCTELRIDTNERNSAARALYRRLGFAEICVVPCRFNGIPGVNLVLLEKKI